MSRRLSKERSRRSRCRRSLFTPKPSNPPWVRGRLIFEQLEHRVPPGSLLGSPLADAAVLGAASLAAMAWSNDDRIDGSSSVSQASSVAQDAREPWLYLPSSPAPAATRGAEQDSSDARMQDTPPIATSAALMSSVQVGLGLHLEHELTPLLDEADDEQEHRSRGRTTLESMFADDSSSRNSDPSRGLEGISIGEDFGAAAGGGVSVGLGAGGSFAPSGSAAELPFWPSSADTSLPPGESSTVQPSLASAESEFAEASAPLTASAPADRAAYSQRLGFDDGLDGWTVSQSGGSLDGLGTVTSGSAVLREGDSFLVTLEREIVIPDDPVAIEFIYIASFDTTDPYLINDAFEVALLDADGYSLVDTFTAQRDAYFNLTEDLPATLGAGVAHTAVSQGHQVSLDISNVPPGTEATLTFRLVNNDTDTETTVTILSVDVTSLASSSISGYVYLDVNNNGIKDPPEQGLPNVPITLDGAVSRTVVTAADGSYRFDELPPGTYEIVQSQPLAFDDGRDTQGTPLLGSVENNRFYDIQLGADVHAVNYNFGELGLRAPFIGKHLLLASTPPAGQLLAELMVPGGEWYGFQAATEGTATVSVPANVSEPVIQIYTADMKPVAMSNGQHRLTAPVQQGTQYVLHVSGQGGESEFQPTLQFDWTPPPDPSPLVGRTNPNNPLDVNADGLVTPQDVLILINALNATSVAAAQATNDYYLDVDGNGLVTPADVLIVINHLNATRPPVASSAEGEGASLEPRTANVPNVPITAVPGTVMNPQAVRGNFPYSQTVAMLAAEGESGLNHPVQSPDGDTLLGPGDSVTFTTSEDFLNGTLFNLNVTEVPNELRLNPAGEIQTFPYIWISNSGEGTVSKIDTRTGEEKGRYRTGPGTGFDPSRIAVDSEGNAWVGNRAGNRQASIVKILNTGFIDRNGNGIADTSSDTDGDGRISGDELFPWDADGDGQPDDERIALWIPVGRDRADPTRLVSNGIARSMAVDADDNVWVGLWNLRQYEVYDGQTGELLAIVPTSCSPSSPRVVVLTGRSSTPTASYGAPIAVRLSTRSTPRPAPILALFRTAETTTVSRWGQTVLCGR